MEFYFSLLLFFLFLFFFFTTNQYLKSKFTEKSRHRLSPKVSLWQLIRNKHRFFQWTTDLVIASPTNTVMTYAGVLTANPANVEHFLKTRFDNYVKGERSVSNLKDFMGDGIFNADGEQWWIQRKTASHEFSTKSVRMFMMEVVRDEVVHRLIPVLADFASNDASFDIQELLERFAFDNVCRVAFNFDPARLVGGSKEVNEFFRSFVDSNLMVQKRFAMPFEFVWKLMKWLNVGSERRLKESLSKTNEFLLKIIRERKGETDLQRRRSDILSRFIVDNRDYSDEFLRDLMIAFLLGGRDTISSVLTWSFWLLSNNKEVEHKIREEINRIRIRKEAENEDFFFSLEDLREMNYLHAALSETLRLYPGAPLDWRGAAGDDVWPDGMVVKRGCMVMYNSFAMGRLKSIWGEDCTEFKPERWLNDDGVFQPVSPYIFPVFHGGPRTCIGKDLAFLEAKAVVAAVLERFEVEVEEKVPEFDYNVILTIKNGLKVKIRERK